MYEVFLLLLQEILCRIKGESWDLEACVWGVCKETETCKTRREKETGVQNMRWGDRVKRGRLCQRA